jgi:hypothetical protein
MEKMMESKITIQSLREDTKNNLNNLINYLELVLPDITHCSSIGFWQITWGNLMLRKSPIWTGTFLPYNYEIIWVMVTNDKFRIKITENHAIQLLKKWEEQEEQEENNAN